MLQIVIKNGKQINFIICPAYRPKGTPLVTCCGHGSFVDSNIATIFQPHATGCLTIVGLNAE